jgi:hypothetical protein
MIAAAFKTSLMSNLHLNKFHPGAAAAVSTLIRMSELSI